MRLQWRSGQQGKQGDTFVGFSRLVGVGHASFEVLKIGRERGAVCATSHTTDFPYSTSISASSIAAGVSGRIFLLPLQANLFCIGNPAEDGFSYFAARHNHAPSALQREPSTPRRRYVRHRTDPTCQSRYAEFKVQSQRANAAHRAWLL